MNFELHEQGVIQIQDSGKRRFIPAGHPDFKLFEDWKKEGNSPLPDGAKQAEESYRAKREEERRNILDELTALEAENNLQEAIKMVSKILRFVIG
jgi:5-formyltetrahydrofolate cyclo-ligase